MAEDTLDQELTKALQQARKKPRNFAIIGKGANCLKLLVSKKSIKPNDIQAAKKETGGKVVLTGICGGQGGPELVFQVTEESPFSEIKLKAFLSEQTGLNFKPQFQLVTDLPQIDESEGEEQESVEEASAAQSDSAATANEPIAEPDEADAGKVLAALNRLAPEIKSVVTAHPDQRADVLQHVSTIQQQLKQGDAAAAQATFAALQRLIGDLSADRSSPSAAASESATTAADVRKGTVDYAKCRLAWEAAKKSVHADLQKLERTILAEFNDAPGLNQLTTGVRKLDSVLLAFEEDLADLLDDALNAQGDAERQKLHQQAAALVEKFTGRALQDPLLQVLDDNPFVPIKARQTLTATLGVLASRLK